MTPHNPHEGQPILAAGAPLAQAKAAMILLHGRGAPAESILSLAPEVGQSGFAYLAPQAANHTWYPYSFLAPIADNEPHLSSALAAVQTTLAGIETAGIPPERTVILGFSQGACLTLEFAARHPRRYGGIIAFTGGLIGEEGTPRDYIGSLDGTPVFIGSSDVDFHVPLQRVQASARILRELGGDVTMRIYPNMGHTINQDEIEFTRQLMSSLSQGS